MNRRILTKICYRIKTKPIKTIGILKFCFRSNRNYYFCSNNNYRSYNSNKKTTNRCGNSFSVRLIWILTVNRRVNIYKPE